jgi:hypothetical protein
MREKFEDLKRSGQLSTPEQCAAQLLDYALSDAFGETPVADIREIAKSA